MKDERPLATVPTVCARSYGLSNLNSALPCSPTKLLMTTKECKHFKNYIPGRNIVNYLLPFKYSARS